MTDHTPGPTIWPDVSVRLLTFYLIWVGAMSAGPLIYATDTLWSGMLTADQLPETVRVAQILVLVLVWPLFLSEGIECVPRPSSDSSQERDPYRRPFRFLIHGATIMACALPVIVMTATFSAEAWAQVWTGQVHVGALVLGTGWIWWGGRGGRSWLPGYYALMLSLTFLPPVMYVLLRRAGSSEDAWLLILSPLTVFIDPANETIPSPWVLQVMLFIGGGGLVGVLLYLRDR